MIYEDYEKFAKWFTDMETAIGLGDAAGNFSIENTKGFFEKYYSSKVNHFSIIEAKEDKLIGFCWLKDLNSIDRSTELAILIGDPEYRGRGYGFEATNLVVDYCFNILNLHNVLVVAYVLRLVLLEQSTSTRTLIHRLNVIFVGENLNV